MLRWKQRLRKLAYMIVDITSLLASCILVNIFTYGTGNEITLLSGFERLSFGILYGLTFVFVCHLFGIYESTIISFGKVRLKTGARMLISLLLTQIFIIQLMLFIQVEISGKFIASYTFITILLVTLNRIIVKNIFWRKNKKSINRNILLIGHSILGNKYIQEIKKHDYLNINIIGYVFIKKDASYPLIKTMGNIDDLTQIVTDFVVDEITVARPLSYDERLEYELDKCQKMGITITMLLDTHNNNAHVQVAMVGSLPVLKFHTVCLNETQLLIKRMIDVIGALIGIVLFGMTYIILGTIIKLESPGPILYKQDRMGCNGRVFKLLKFRSMGVDADAQETILRGSNEIYNHIFKIEDDPRVTRVGRFIRKTNLDELPQFLNVLKGDMSLVGIRPPTVEDVAVYEKSQLCIISIIPGMTGVWQVSNSGDIDEFEEIVRIDAEYIENWSIALDIRILIRTLMIVFKRLGSS